MKCLNCNETHHEPTAKFCHVCGVSIFVIMNNKCPTCGVEIVKGARFCYNCGTQLVNYSGYTECKSGASEFCPQIIKNGTGCPMAVDLGLSSGTKWASCNIGAANPEDFGGYFAWGEIEEKNEYDENTYKWYRWSDTRRCRELAKYCDSMVFGKVDNKWKLDLKDDVAHVKWGNNWRIPTQEQFQELKAQCKSEWIPLNGVEGRRFTSKKNGNSIFLPACGYLSGTELRENHLRKIGNYWSSYNGPISTEAGVLRLSKSDVSADGFSLRRIYGGSIRPVLK